ncbi:MAG: helix-hairpin-helix domain-containing protein [Candidatus Omnitrophota bacterium]
MFNLEKYERLLILFLTLTLLLGVGLSFYKKSRSRADIKIGSFNIDKENLHRKININTAGPDELAGLKGVGNVLAERVVECRSQKGRFSSIEDIKKVKGVGPVLFDKIKDDITVE